MSNAQHWIARRPAAAGQPDHSRRQVGLAPLGDVCALADGTSHIEGFLARTPRDRAHLQPAGVRIETPSPSQRVHGVGIDGLKAPDAPLDCGNAGTGMRLLAGLLAGQSFDCTLIGDESRPVARCAA